MASLLPACRNDRFGLYVRARFFLVNGCFFSEKNKSLLSPNEVLSQHQIGHEQRGQTQYQKKARHISDRSQQGPGGDRGVHAKPLQ